MTQAQPQIPATASRLVRFLAELVDTNTTITHKHFTERLGQLIDFSDSVALSAAHARQLDVEDEDTLLSSSPSAGGNGVRGADDGSGLNLP